MTDTPADQFTRHLNALTRDIGELGLYWRGDLAQFSVTTKGLVHVCGNVTPLTGGERRLDYVAQIATTHLLGCELRQGQAPMPQVPEHQAPETTA